jgi:hypothetical protein
VNAERRFGGGCSRFALGIIFSRRSAALPEQ